MPVAGREGRKLAENGPESGLHLGCIGPTLGVHRACAGRTLGLHSHPWGGGCSNGNSERNVKTEDCPKPGLDWTGNANESDRQKSNGQMDPEEEADRMLGTLNNVISELMTAKNKAQKHRDRLRRRGVSEEDVRAAKAELASLANSVDVAADGLGGISEPVEE